MDDPVEKLAKDMLDHMASLRKLVINQQETLAGIAAMMKVHTTSLKMHQRIIEQLAAESGMAFTSEDPSPPDPVNWTLVQCSALDA